MRGKIYRYAPHILHCFCELKFLRLNSNPSDWRDLYYEQLQHHDGKDSHQITETGQVVRREAFKSTVLHFKHKTGLIVISVKVTTNEI